jgi:hypothetical protein|tara:strand:+ start:408 stop:710 length:303 start_codon:yes stop_codon:yes gene_type:complete
MSLIVTYDQFAFLDRFRENHNPMGATPDLMALYALDRHDASTVLRAWMDTYSSLEEPHTRESRQARVDKANADRHTCPELEGIGQAMDDFFGKYTSKEEA